MLQPPSLEKRRESVLFGNKKNLNKGFLKGFLKVSKNYKAIKNREYVTGIELTDHLHFLHPWTDISVDISTDISVECRLTYRPMLDRYDISTDARPI